MPTPTVFFDATDLSALQQAAASVRSIVSTIPLEPVYLRPSAAGVAQVSPPTAEDKPTEVIEAIEEQTTYSIPPADLLGVDNSLYLLIEQALAVKRHLMFYGPPGTGKTTLAEHVARIVGDDTFKLVTGSSDWTSQDLIGGYQPDGKGGIQFAPGLILDNFNQPLIIDELNRVDIDKAIGPLFTVLSGQATTLAYVFDPASDERKRVHIFPKKQASLQPHEYAPASRWRLLATINTVDKASLYQMSYALSRRFAWILVDVPSDLIGFIIDYLIEQGHFTEERNPLPTTLPLATIWAAVNQVRPLGAAPIIDIINLCRATDTEFNFTRIPPTLEQQIAYLNGFYAFLLPLLDGILQSDAEQIAKSVCAALSISLDSDEAKHVRSRVTYHAI